MHVRVCVYIYVLSKPIQRQAHPKPKTQTQMAHHQRSSPFPSCFRPLAAAPDHRHPPLPWPLPPATTSGNPNLTTCLYHTDLGLFSLTWSRSFLGHSLHLQLHPIDTSSASSAVSSSPFSLSDPLSLSTISFHLHIKPFIFWKKRGSKKLHVTDHHPETESTSRPSIKLFWDLSRARFGSGPEPEYGFYIAVVVDREIVLLIGDLTKAACAKTKARRPADKAQVLVLRREHVFGYNNKKVYVTKVRFRGKIREISVDCNVNSDASLSFSVDSKKVLLIKRLKWKFRGNERIEVDGVPIQVSWDVYNWLFDDASSNRHAVFMLRFETDCCELDGKEEDAVQVDSEICCENVEDEGKNGAVSFSGMEWRKMRKSLMMRTARSSSSSSISLSSSAASSSGCSSSVMEWASMEESELRTSSGFSLLIYAWKK